MAVLTMIKATIWVLRVKVRKKKMKRKNHQEIGRESYEKIKKRIFIGRGKQIENNKNI